MPDLDSIIAELSKPQPEPTAADRYEGRRRYAAAVRDEQISLPHGQTIRRHYCTPGPGEGLARVSASDARPDWVIEWDLFTKASELRKTRRSAGITDSERAAANNDLARTRIAAAQIFGEGL